MGEHAALRPVQRRLGVLFFVGAVLFAQLLWLAAFAYLAFRVF
jgi:hypothetical protein